MIRLHSTLPAKPFVARCALAAVLCVGAAAPFAAGAALQVGPQPEGGIEVAEDAQADAALDVDAAQEDAAIAMDGPDNAASGITALDGGVQAGAADVAARDGEGQDPTAPEVAGDGSEQRGGQEAPAAAAGICYLDENGKEQNTGADEVIDISDASFKVEKGYTLGDGWYVVRKSRDFGSRLTITGNAKIILCDGAEANFKHGIRGKSGKLTIYAQSTGEEMGKLVAKGCDEGAGIGGDNDESNGTEINICGGRIEATGDCFGAGIGGGDHGGCGIIKIYGGDVTASGGKEPWWSLDLGAGAGIGSGDAAKQGGVVEIHGGSVKAYGKDYSAGVGTGDEAKVPVDINITGGYVGAWAGTDAAGIGGGNESRCDVEISGGRVDAYGGKWGAGIGTGDESKCGKITISGGDVTTRGGTYAAGVGGGNESKCDVTISGGKVDAYGGKWGAGIGTGDECGSGGTIVITGGHVAAQDGGKGAGIGGGNETNGGTIEISGGTVVTTGVGADCASSAYEAMVNERNGLFDPSYEDTGGAGIGGGDEGDSGTITITGGDVWAEALGDGARAIGHGDDGKNKTITLGDNIKVVGNKGRTLTGKDRDDAIKKWHWVRTQPMD